MTHLLNSQKVLLCNLYRHRVKLGVLFCLKQLRLMKAERAQLSCTQEVGWRPVSAILLRTFSCLLHRNKPLKAIKSEFVPLSLQAPKSPRPSQLLSSIALNNEKPNCRFGVEHGIFCPMLVHGAMIR